MTRSPGLDQPLERLLGFVGLLRASGISVSPAEAGDALRAIALVPEVLARRETLEAVLAGALIKRSADRPLFLALFAAYFGPGEDQHAPHDHGHAHDDGEGELVGVDLAAEPGLFADAGPPRHEHGTSIDLRRYFGDVGPGEQGHDHHGGDRLRLSWLGKDLLFDRAGGPPPGAAGWDGAFSLHRVRTIGRPGALRPDDGQVELPSEVVLRGHEDLWRLSGGAELPSDVLAWAEQVARGGRPTPRTPKSPTWAGDGDPELPDLAWDALTASDLVRLERAIARLGRRFGGAPGRRRPGRQGRLDARATMRLAAATGGIPFRPRYRERADDRPRRRTQQRPRPEPRRARRAAPSLPPPDLAQPGGARFLASRRVRPPPLRSSLRPAGVGANAGASAMPWLPLAGFVTRDENSGGKTVAIRRILRPGDQEGDRPSGSATYH